MAATMTPSVLRLSILADRHPSLANVASFLLVDSDDSVVTAFADFTELLLRVVPQDTAEFPLR